MNGGRLGMVANHFEPNNTSPAAPTPQLINNSPVAEIAVLMAAFFVVEWVAATDKPPHIFTHKWESPQCNERIDVGTSA